MPAVLVPRVPRLFAAPPQRVTRVSARQTIKISTGRPPHRPPGSFFERLQKFLRAAAAGMWKKRADAQRKLLAAETGRNLARRAGAGGEPPVSVICAGRWPCLICFFATPRSYPLSSRTLHKKAHTFCTFRTNLVARPACQKSCTFCRKSCSFFIIHPVFAGLRPVGPPQLYGNLHNSNCPLSCKPTI